MTIVTPGCSAVQGTSADGPLRTLTVREYTLNVARKSVAGKTLRRAEGLELVTSEPTAGYLDSNAPSLRGDLLKPGYGRA